MMRFCIMLGLLLFSGIVHAACPGADAIARSNGLKKALPIYITCAVYENDDTAQLYLAQVYETGKGDVPKNIQRALLFYHLGVENGNATAMVGMSKLLTYLDSSDKTRPEIPLYLEKLRNNLTGSLGQSFRGQLLHPYTLLLLAAEKPSAKWFYLTTVKSDPNAASLLKSYKIEPQKKQACIAEATQWKQRRMMDIAREVFSVREYNDFYDILYPEVGIPDAFARERAVNRLKERIERKFGK